MGPFPTVPRALPPNPEPVEDRALLGWLLRQTCEQPAWARSQVASPNYFGGLGIVHIYVGCVQWLKRVPAAREVLAPLD